MEGLMAVSSPLLKMMALILVVWLSLVAVLASVGLIVSATGQDVGTLVGLFRLLAALVLFAVWALWTLMLVQFWYLRVLRR
jgi:hypothetical protein